MDSYKKQSLKFSSTNVSRNMRHAETLKARESSRFKRLSMLRDISENEVQTSFEAEKLNEVKEVEKPGLSRLERLRKWRQEKELKKQLDMKNSRKPFYVSKAMNQPAFNVSNKNPQSLQSSFVSRPNISFNTSRAAKNVNLVSKPSVQPTGSRVQTISKQLTKSSSIQTSRIPSNLKPKTPMTRAASEKAPPVVKQHISKLVKPTESVIKTSSAARSANKVTLLTKKPSVKNIPAETKRIMPTVSSLKTGQESSLPKLTFSRMPGKTVQKASVTNAQRSIPLPKPVSKASTPASSKKPAAPPKPVQKEDHLPMNNVTTRKGFCFKKAANDARKQPAEHKKGPDAVKPVRKAENSRSVNAESLSGNIPEMTLNFDLSIIKREDSFAPHNFLFRPPAGLLDFKFDDDEEEEDPLEVLQEIKLKYLSRTSTPSKSRKNSESPNEASVLPHGNTPLTDSANSLQKVSQTSGSQTLYKENTSTLQTVDTWHSCSMTSLDMSVTDAAMKKELFVDSVEKVLGEDCETPEANKQDCAASENVAGHELLVQCENLDDVSKQCIVSLTCGGDVPKTAADIIGLRDSCENEIGEGGIGEIPKVDETKNDHPKYTSENEDLAKCSDIPIDREDSNLNQNHLDDVPKAGGVTEELIDLDDGQILKSKDEPGSESVEILHKSENSVLDGKGLGRLVELDDGIHLTKCDGVVGTDTAPSDSRVNEDGRCEEVLKAGVVTEELIGMNGKDEILESKDEAESELVGTLHKSEHSVLDGSRLGLLVELDEGVNEVVTKTDAAPSDSGISDVGICEADLKADDQVQGTPSEDLAASWKFPFGPELSEIKNLAEEKLELVDSDDDEFIGKIDFIDDPEFLKISSGVPPPRKRVSTLKSVSTLNAIAESSEADVSIIEPSEFFQKGKGTSSVEGNQNMLTPRRSSRLSRRHAEIIKDSKINLIEEEDLLDLQMTPVTPRRSLRLQKAAAAAAEAIKLKDESSSKPKATLRRSMRLIDLNTPEKDSIKQSCYSKTHLTEDFGRMNLDDTENRNPGDHSVFLNSSPEVAAKSSRVSLLYTPNRRKSIRKSIKGDLISFSPSS